MTTGDVQSPAAPAPVRLPQVRAKRRRGMRDRHTVAIAVGRLASVLAVVALWQFSSGRWIGEYLISSPVQIVRRLIDLIQAGTVWTDLGVTAVEFFLGYGLGVSLGLILGLLLGGLPLVGKVFEPLISALNGIPKIALAPLMILWLGIGVESKVGITVLTVFFVMFYNTYIGMRTVPQPLVNALRVMGANKPTIVRKVVIPQMSMVILAGLRAGIPFAAIGVIVGEFVASSRGLGYYIRTSTDAYDAAGIFAGIVLLMVLITAMSLVVGVWERRVTRWQR